MKKFLKKAMGFLFALALVMGMVGTLEVNAAAGQVNDGKLYFNGGQNSSKVYSEIYDAKTSELGTPEDYNYFNVIAYVKVGGTEYNSHWKQGYAYKSASRKWYANETSYYDYTQRAGGYTTWGGDVN